eukprot:2222235-Rhodomonas_salina.3
MTHMHTHMRTHAHARTSTDARRDQHKNTPTQRPGQPAQSRKSLSWSTGFRGWHGASLHGIGSPAPWLLARLGARNCNAMPCTGTASDAGPAAT